MGTIRFVLVLFITMASLGAGEFDKEKLLPLLRFPLENFGVGFAVTADGVRLLNNEVEEPPIAEQIARAELRRATHPENPQNYSELAFLHQKAGNTKLAGELLVDAAERFHVTMAETNRHESALVEGFAKVLRASGRSGQAEKLLRARVEKAPEDHRAWAALGDHQATAAYLVMTGNPTPSEMRFDVMQTLMNRSHTEAQRAEMGKHFTEALSCYERAIRIKADAPELHRKRMIYRLHAGMVRDLERKTGGENAPQDATRNFFKNSLPDVREIARLEPNNPETVAARMFTELVVGSSDGDLAKVMEKDLTKRIPPATRESLQSGISELKKLSGRGDVRSRQVAGVSLGFFQFLLGDESAGEKSIRSAIALDRAHPLGWETLGGLYIMREPRRWNELFLMARERTQYHDTARNHFIAAKAAEKAGKPATAMVELEAALKLDSQHGNSQLASCVLLLREGSGPSIEKAQALVAKLMEQTNLDNDQWRDLMIAGGVLFALGGQPETAREWFENLRRHAPDDERGNVALAAWKG